MGILTSLSLHTSDLSFFFLSFLAQLHMLRHELEATQEAEAGRTTSNITRGRVMHPKVGLFPARPQAKGRAGPGPNRPGQAGPWVTAQHWLWLGLRSQKPKPSRQAPASLVHQPTCHLPSLLIAHHSHLPQKFTGLTKRLEAHTFTPCKCHCVKSLWLISTSTFGT